MRTDLPGERTGNAGFASVAWHGNKSWSAGASGAVFGVCGYGYYVHSALWNPAIVGAHWFQLYDESTTGRFDGENYQIGFVDICDTPYVETVQAAREVSAPALSGPGRTQVARRRVFATNRIAGE